MISSMFVDGLQALTLESRHLRAVVIPELGGRVWELEDRARSRQWIWHRDDVALAGAAAGAVYDDVWAGGWEEVCPNDAPGRFKGRSLPDHGEWWTAAWTAQPSPSDAVHHVRPSTSTRSARKACAKDIVLAPDGPDLSVTYWIRSEEPAPFHFLLKQHLSPHCRLQLPGGEVRQVDEAFGTLIRRGAAAWPLVSGGAGDVDLRVVPERGPDLGEFVDVRDLPAGWCGVDDLVGGASLRFSFDRHPCPYTWLFLSYCGWRNVYTAVLEPCSNMPKDLLEAVRLNQSARLATGEQFVTTVSVRLEGLPA